MTLSFAERLHETRLGLGRRIVEHIRSGTSDLAPAAMRNDVSVYTDPVRHAAERQTLFRETPVVACFSNDVREPGQFRTFDETGVPIVVVRGRDGEVRAFLNVCQHRGARLVREAEGKANLFTCWFHGWSYANDGHLVAAPEADRFCDADGVSAIGSSDHLISVPVAERHGLVFVQATPGSTMDIDAHLGSFGAQLELLELLRRPHQLVRQLSVRGLTPVLITQFTYSPVVGVEEHGARLREPGGVLIRVDEPGELG